MWKKISIVAGESNPGLHWNAHLCHGTTKLRNTSPLRNYHPCPNEINTLICSDEIVDFYEATYFVGVNLVSDGSCNPVIVIRKKHGYNIAIFKWIL